MLCAEGTPRPAATHDGASDTASLHSEPQLRLHEAALQQQPQGAQLIPRQNSVTSSVQVEASMADSLADGGDSSFDEPSSEADGRQPR